MSDATTEVQHVEPEAVKKAVMAASIGNTLEWFDYGVYAYVATTLAVVFFPGDDPATALIGTFAAFAIGFLMRPLGGLFWGPLGDKVGRSRVLAATIILMSFGTVMVGLLPSYDSIGIWAPILLVVARMIQSFSTGGEYGGAATFIVESAPDKRRGFLSSWLEFGTLGGYVAGALLALMLQTLLSEAAFVEWGWRIPFLIGAPLGLFGLYLRLKLEDSPAFRQLEDAHKVSKTPLRELLVDHWREMLLCAGLVLILNAAYYTVLTYLPSYLEDIIEMSKTHALVLSVAVMVGMMVVITFIGRLSDHIGRKPVILAAFLGFIFLSWPSYWMLSQGILWMTITGLVILHLLVVMLSATMPAVLPSIFPTRVRYGGFAISYNVSTVIFGGFAPMVITLMIKLTGLELMPAYYLMLAAAIALIPLALLRETAGKPLRGSPALKSHSG